MTLGSTLIGGRWRDGDHETLVTNPVNASVVGSVHWSDGDAHEAADAAAAAFESWSETTARQRADILTAAAGLVVARAGAIGELLAREAGKRLPEAVGEVTFSAEYLRWFGEQARRPTGDIVPHELTERRHLTLRRPSGVVASLTPWNFPCSIQARKLAPALAAGCTVVARVSEKAPLAVTELVRCLTDAGVPAGVINLVHGPSRATTEALLDHRAVRVVSFTGSTQVGSQIMARAARRIVRPLLELGGDAPFIVFDDADIDAAIEGAMIAKFRNTGQSCIAANRFFVHERVWDEFVGGFVARVDAMSIGDGLADPCPDLSALIDVDRVQAVQGLIDDALGRGAQRLTAQRPEVPRGAFIAPTLLADVPDDVAMGCEEVFGPAAAVLRFRDEDEVLRRANATEMGLAGYFYSRDIGRLWRMAERLEVGIVGANNPLPTTVFAPMGGVKQSGLGREGADLGLEEFQDVRYLALGL